MLISIYRQYRQGRGNPAPTSNTILGTFLSILLLASPAVVLAHGGHGDEFKGGNETQTGGSIEVDAETARRLGIKVEPAKRQRLGVGIKTTGQIETLPRCICCG